MKLKVTAMLVIVGTFCAVSFSRAAAPPDLDAWLIAHPQIAKAIVCEWEAGTIDYAQWTPPKKKRLQFAFSREWAHTPSKLPDPPANAYQNGDLDLTRQALSEADALALYLETVANSLVVEIRHEVPWSVQSYTPEELADLFDSRQFFERQPPEPGANTAVYRIVLSRLGNCLPAPPEVGRAFLEKQHIVAATPRETVGKILEWCVGLSHFLGERKTANLRDHWHYDGFPPESRIISGTIYEGSSPSWHGKPFHLTAGCWGTTGFLRAVLRAVNLPVEQVVGGTHSIPYFPTLPAYMSHGDDPYNLMIITMSPGIKGTDLLISPERFQELFRKTKPEVAANNVEIRVKELAIERLPIQLLSRYLDDQQSHKSHEDGEVFKGLKAAFPLADLEGRHLWERMDTRIAELGGPDKVRALRKELIERVVNTKLDP